MVYTLVRRNDDSLITGAQSSPAAPNEETMIANAVAELGGVPSDFELVTLTQEQFDTIIAALPGRSFLNNDIITSTTPPALSAVSDSDNHRVTVTCEVSDAGYNGPIAWECLSPDGVAFKTSGNASAGAEDWIIETGQIGFYRVRVDVELFGSAEIEFREA